MKTSKFLFIIISIFFINHLCYSQRVATAILNSTGGSASLGYYKIEWSLGEAIAINTMEDNSRLTLANGLLQPNANPSTGKDYSTEWSTGDIRIFPNPTKNITEINFLSPKKGKVTINLFTAAGQLLGSKQFDYYGVGRIEKWDLKKYPAAEYFFKIEMIQARDLPKIKSSYGVHKLAE